MATFAANMHGSVRFAVKANGAEARLDCITVRIAGQRWTEEIAMDNGLMFDDFLQAVEWAEENIREDFEVIRQPDGRYLVRECE